MGSIRGRIRLCSLAVVVLGLACGRDDNSAVTDAPDTFVDNTSLPGGTTPGDMMPGDTTPPTSAGDESGTPLPTCSGPSPVISPRPASPKCVPDVPCVVDGNCPSGHVCNTELDPPGCALLYCGAVGTPCHDEVVCAEGQQCINGLCNPCDFCGDLCTVDFATSPKHCGCCDNPVAEGGVCLDGVPGCPAGRTLCGDRCVDLSNDPEHCGSCDNALGDGVDCVMGVAGCEFDGFSNRRLCDGKCVDVDNDAKNCGTCGAKCPYGYCAGDGICFLDVDDPKLLPINCKSMCSQAGMVCNETAVKWSYGSYSGWCDSAEEYVASCNDIPPPESYEGEYCGGSCTCKIDFQRCYCPANKP